MTVIAVPEVLREKLGVDGTEALVELLNRSTERTRNDVLLYVEERFERRLAQETGRLRDDLLRWMFTLWVGQIAVLTGILFAFFRS